MPSAAQQKVCQLLQQEQIPYEMTQHAAVYTIAEMEALQVEEKGQICKNLFLAEAKGPHFYLCMLAKEKKADLKAIRAQIGSSRLHFASPRQLLEKLQLTQGAVGPFGLFNDDAHDTVFLIDSSLKGQILGMHPNDNTATVWLSYEHLLALLQKLGHPIYEVTV